MSCRGALARSAPICGHDVERERERECVCVCVYCVLCTGYCVLRAPPSVTYGSLDPLATNPSQTPAARKILCPCRRLCRLRRLRRLCLSCCACVYTHSVRVYIYSVLCPIIGIIYLSIACFMQQGFLQGIARF